MVTTAHDALLNVSSEESITSVELGGKAIPFSSRDLRKTARLASELKGSWHPVPSVRSADSYAPDPPVLSVPASHPSTRVCGIIPTLEMDAFEGAVRKSSMTSALSGVLSCHLFRAPSTL